MLAYQSLARSIQSTVLILSKITTGSSTSQRFQIKILYFLADAHVYQPRSQQWCFSSGKSTHCSMGLPLPPCLFLCIQVLQEIGRHWHALLLPLVPSQLLDQTHLWHLQSSKLGCNLSTPLHFWSKHMHRSAKMLSQEASKIIPKRLHLSYAVLSQTGLWFSKYELFAGFELHPSRLD